MVNQLYYLLLTSIVDIYIYTLFTYSYILILPLFT